MDTNWQLDNEYISVILQKHVNIKFSTIKGQAPLNPELKSENFDILVLVKNTCCFPPKIDVVCLMGLGRTLVVNYSTLPWPGGSVRCQWRHIATGVVPYALTSVCSRLWTNPSSSASVLPYLRTRSLSLLQFFLKMIMTIAMPSFKKNEKKIKEPIWSVYILCH